MKTTGVSPEALAAWISPRSRMEMDAMTNSRWVASLSFGQRARRLLRQTDERSERHLDMRRAPRRNHAEVRFCVRAAAVDDAAAVSALREGHRPRYWYPTASRGSFMRVLNDGERWPTTDTDSRHGPALGRDPPTRQGRGEGSSAPCGTQWATRNDRVCSPHGDRLVTSSPHGDRLVTRGELRGLEPLTPTLPGRHDRVRRSPPPIVTTVWAAISSHLETAANG